MAESGNKKRQLKHPFHLARYLDGAALAQCWLPFIGEGAVFVPAQPVRASLPPQAPVGQILLLQLPEGNQYCLQAKTLMILPAGTGPQNKGGYLMLLLKPPRDFVDAVEHWIHTDNNRADWPVMKSIPQWLLSCAGRQSDNAIQ
ncbi:hypothetical protein [Pseudohongiella nitratireducens]|uniref:hypothetical protein n=1 Tax=Pseudohongiella nitratireducens TaxID=1768907 RepID=UPI0030EB1885|tara:strand:- start:4581 stop:5012 length:432 start_codon:yes stop_codon:yes gene_type:complete